MTAIRHYLAADTIDNADIDTLCEWLKGYPRLTKGPVTVQFEEKWSRWLGMPYSVFNNSGSSANLLMYAALDNLGTLRNKKVIVPSVGWVTTVAPAMQLGFEPIMCEADRATFALDPVHLEKLLEEYDAATVVLVQVLGVAADMDAIMALKKKYDFFLLEDCCAAIGTRYGDAFVGTFGDMSSFSFYFGHQMSTIEGGMVSTRDPKLRDLLLMLRSHGWSKDLGKSAHQELVSQYGIDDFHSPFVFYIPGYNLRATDLQAVLGLGQLDKIQWIMDRRAENHGRYLEHLDGKLTFQKAPVGSRICSIHCGALAADTEQRRRIVKALVSAGVETRIFSAGNLGQHPFWYERYGKFSAPWADRIHHTGFFLPNHPTLSLDAVDEIAGLVAAAL